MGTVVTVIPRVRKVYYATYANLPTTGLKAGDLGYATDRLVFYRWSGAAWQEVTIHSSSGVAANIPTAANMPEGSLYYETDTTKLKQIQSGAWVEISAEELAILTTNEDIIVRKAGSPARVAKGSDGEYLGVAGGVVGYSVPPKAAFTELAGGEAHLIAGSASTWEDWDISAIIPAGAVSALIGIVNHAINTIHTGGARKNGTALVRTFLVGWGAYAVQTHILTECDANRIIDIYATNKGEIDFSVLGYWS